MAPCLLAPAVAVGVAIRAGGELAFDLEEAGLAATRLAEEESAEATPALEGAVSVASQLPARWAAAAIHSQQEAVSVASQFPVEEAGAAPVASRRPVAGLGQDRLRVGPEVVTAAIAAPGVAGAGWPPHPSSLHRPRCRWAAGATAVRRVAAPTHPPKADCFRVGSDRSN
jgi:hypothetical protein